MSDHHRVTYGRVHWQRFALIMIPATMLAATIAGLTATGSIAADIAVSGSAFEITAAELSGTGLEEYSGTARQADGTARPVAVAAISDARLSDLCLSATAGPLSVVIRAGDGATTATGRNLIVGLDQMGTDGALSHVWIGQDASTLTAVPGATGIPGGFGLQAGPFSLKHLRVHSWFVTAGTFALPGMTISLARHGC
jgi:hypothetical protein